MRISQKLIIGFMILIGIVGLSSYWAVQISKETLLNSIGRESTVLTARLLDRIDRLIYHRIEEYTVYAQSSSVQQTFQEFDAEFAKFTDIQSFIDQQDAQWQAFPKGKLSPFMQTILNSPLSQELRGRLEFYKKKYNYAREGEIFITNKYGANIAQTNRTSDYRQNDEVWWQIAKEKGLYVSEPGFDESADVYSLDICIRIDNPDGEFSGVMKVVLNLEQIIDIFMAPGQEEYHVEKLREFKLMNSRYEVIYSSGGDKFGASLSKEFEGHISSQRGPRYWIEKYPGGKEESRLFTYTQSRGFKDYRGLGWILVAEHKTKEILAPVEKLENILFFIIVIVVVSVFEVGILIYRSIAMPIMRLREATVKIGRGRWEIPEGIDKRDEVGQLALAFEDMTKKLRESYETLGEKVKQRTTELQASQESARLIIETATDAFISIDSKGVIRGWNRQAEIIFGWSRSEAIGKALAETIIPIHYKERHRKGLENFLVTGEGPFIGKTVELTALRRDGREFPMEITIWTVQRDGDYQFNAFLRDISKRKEIEEDLKDAQLQLLQSEKLASIGQLAAGVAHEINNPAGFIISNLQSLKQYLMNYSQLLRVAENLRKTIEGKDMEKSIILAEEMSKLEAEVGLNFMMEDTDNLLKESQTGMERIKKIVQDLQTFARVDQDVLEMVRVEEIIDSILNIIYNELKYKVELKKDYGDVPLIKGNPQRLGQVFLNLLLNAVQAIKGKEGVVEIKTYAKDNFVCVDISDTGCGIEGENFNKIFDAFFTTKPVGQGTGLGLSISHEIVKKHGGSITVKSQVGQGSIFTVMLPLEK